MRSDFLTEKTILLEISKKPWYRTYIVGFRQGKVWRSAIAIACYFILIYYILNTYESLEANKITLGSWLSGALTFSFSFIWFSNYLNIQDFFIHDRNDKSFKGIFIKFVYGAASSL